MHLSSPSRRLRAPRVACLWSRPRRHHSLCPTCIPSAVRLVEVGPRDGLQNEPTVVPAEQRFRLVQLLHEAGLTHVEVGSFVSPRVRAMAHSGDVVRMLRAWRPSLPAETMPADAIVWTGLVPNVQGLEAALEAGVDEIALLVAASEGFSRRNLNASRHEAMERNRALLERLAQHSRTVRVRGYVSCVVACPYDGPVAPATVTDMTLQLLAMGCHQVSLGDTIGVGTPASVARLLQDVQDNLGPDAAAGDDRIAVHFHDTYGQGLANVLVSLERGIRTVDASVAGLGGCPFAKGATGNVATEDVVYMLHGLGVHTGVDLDKLVDAGEYICGVLGIESKSRAGRAILAKR